ncbi:hypothetical protein Pfo_031607 [Paulownia fortunei]|nr:hypothetical protein Pfo_031607 [Paulownia fortunei]
MASTPVAIIVAWFVISRARHYIDQQQDATGKMNGYINEQINGEKIIITQGLQKESMLDLPHIMKLSNKQLLRVKYTQQYYQPITQITSIYNMLQLAVTGARRLSDVDEQVEEISPVNGQKLTGVSSNVTLKDIHFAYQENKEILHGVSIDVQKGEMVALVGPTGSGKTTEVLLHFDGVDVRDLDLKSLREHVGIVLQDSVLFSGTIADNIKFGDPEASDEAMIMQLSKPTFTILL